MSPDFERAWHHLSTSWRGFGLASDAANPNWVRLLAQLDPDFDVSYELFGQSTVGPPRTWDWPYVSGADALQATLAMGDVTAIAQEQYRWMSADLRGASYLTGFRGQDLSRAWLTVTDGRRLGRLAGVGVARALFETGLEAFRVSTMTFRTLESAPESATTLTTFGDGLWVHLHRYIGGEKTDRVGARDQTRNTLSNIGWLRRGASTARVAEAYDLASHCLHAGTDEATDDADLARAELLLLAAGASGTLQSYQRFKLAAQAVDAMSTRIQDRRYDDICVLGADPNIAPLLTSSPEEEL